MFARDDYAIVLDFLPRGRASGKPEPLAQVLGDKYFGLLEVVVRPGMAVKTGDKIYIGDNDRKEVDHIKPRIGANELTTLAKSEINFAVDKIVKEDEPRFVDFFNKATSLSTRVHQLELLPGIGKKHMWDIIGERKKGPFKDFEDLKNRVKLLPDPRGMIIKRIVEEIENENERYRAFAAGPPQRDRW